MALMLKKRGTEVADCTIVSVHHSWIFVDAVSLGTPDLNVFVKHNEAGLDSLVSDDRIAALYYWPENWILIGDMCLLKRHE